jgi:hypothetical protein
MSISGVTSNDLLYQLYQSSNAASSTQNATNTQAAQSSSPFDQILQSLGTDLQSGNLQNSQQDFAKLQQALQGINQVHGHHHHHKHGSGANQANSGQTTQTASTAGATPTASNLLSTAVSGITQNQAATTSTS